MPEVFRQLQELDEKRVRNVRHFVAHSADVERNVFPIINKCLDGIINAANQINEKQVNKIKSLTLVLLYTILQVKYNLKITNYVIKRTSCYAC